GADAIRDPLSRTDQAGGGTKRGGEFQCRGAGMERADHFFAQDRPGGCRQELRDSGGAPGWSAKGNSRSRERHSFAFGKPEWCGSARQIKTKKIGPGHSSIAKTAARFALDAD